MLIYNRQKIKKNKTNEIAACGKEAGLSTCKYSWGLNHKTPVVKIRG